MHLSAYWGELGYAILAIVEHLDRRLARQISETQARGYVTSLYKLFFSSYFLGAPIFYIR
jgi:hypothetical protein